MYPIAKGNFDFRSRPYLDTASYGLPPHSTVAAVAEALEAWRLGSARWSKDWDPAGDRCRPLAAQLLGAAPDEIALIPAVSVGVGVALSMLSPGDEVLISENEFTSMLFPLLVAEKRFDIKVRTVPFDELAAQVRSSTALVMTSHVRSNDGRVQDLGELSKAIHVVGGRILVDATHSAGIMQIDATAMDLDVVVAAAYKHLLCPRGVALMRVGSDLLPALSPWAASWRSAAQPYDHFYGGDLSVLADTAARLDVSLAWHGWVGAEQSLDFLCSVPIVDRESWCVGLATRLADGLGIMPTGSSVIGVPVLDGDAARAALATAGIEASGRGSLIRLSFHLYNSVEDVDLAVGVLAPFIDYATNIDYATKS